VHYKLASEDIAFKQLLFNIEKSLLTAWKIADIS